MSNGHSPLLLPPLMVSVSDFFARVPSPDSPLADESRVAGSSPPLYSPRSVGAALCEAANAKQRSIGARSVGKGSES